MCDRADAFHEPICGLESAHRVGSRDVIGTPKADVWRARATIRDGRSRYMTHGGLAGCFASVLHALAAFFTLDARVNAS